MNIKYNSLYLEELRETVGNMFEYVKEECNYSIEEFINDIVESRAAEYIEDGNPKFVVGMSAIELVEWVLTKVNKDFPNNEKAHNHMFDYPSPEYSFGAALIYFQYNHDMSFKQIIERYDLSLFLDLYLVYQDCKDHKIDECFLMSKRK